jgi:hypothetical protein
VEAVGACGLGFADLLAEAGEIGSEDGRSKLDGILHGMISSSIQNSLTQRRQGAEELLRLSF